MKRKGLSNIMEIVDAFQDMFETKFDYEDFSDFHFGGRRFPRTKISREESEVRLVAEIPGVRKEDIKLEIKGDVFTLSGKRSSPLGVDAESGEPKCKTFRKDVRLPCGVDADRIDAKYENGILFVTLPIKESEMPRNITVN